MGTKEELLATGEDLPSEEVETPEWAKAGWPKVRVRKMGGSDYDEWEALMLSNIARAKLTGESPLKGTRAAYATVTLCDPVSGKRIFSSADFGRVERMDGDVLNRLAAVAERLTPVSTRDQKELEKNSEGGRSGAFASVFPWQWAAQMWTRLFKSSASKSSSSGAPSS